MSDFVVRPLRPHEATQVAAWAYEPPHNIYNGDRSIRRTTSLSTTTRACLHDRSPERDHEALLTRGAAISKERSLRVTPPWQTRLGPQVCFGATGLVDDP
jgi:hypothetical protein